MMLYFQDSSKIDIFREGILLIVDNSNIRVSDWMKLWSMRIPKKKNNGFIVAHGEGISSYKRKIPI